MPESDLKVTRAVATSRNPVRVAVLDNQARILAEVDIAFYIGDQIHIRVARIEDDPAVVVEFA